MVQLGVDRYRPCPGQPAARRPWGARRAAGLVRSAGGLAPERGPVRVVPAARVPEVVVLLVVVVEERVAAGRAAVRHDVVRAVPGVAAVVVLRPAGGGAHR